MDVVNLAFPSRVEARDYHLLPGYVSPRLDQIIRVNYDSDGDGIADKNGRADNLPSDVKIGFVSTDHLPNIAVDPVTGEVAVPSPLPAAAPGKPWPQEYRVACVVAQAGNPIDTIFVRIWIHAGLESVWITPERLTVRQDQNGVRFSLLAKFTDGTMGDLSNWSPMKAPAPADHNFVRVSGAPFAIPIVVWQATGSGISIPESATGFLKCSNPAAADVKVQALVNLASPPGSQLLAAKAFGAPSWSTRRQIEPVTTESAFSSMSDRLNVLFLPDGFDEIGHDQFKMLARETVSRLTKNAMTRPFDLLKDQFNFFMAWVPSPESDIMVSAELVQKPYSGPAAPASITLNDVVLYDGVMTGTRVLENERDTSFHLAMGDRPMAENEADPSAPTFHPLRMTDEDFETFLKNLSSDPSNSGHAPEGTIWAAKDPTPSSPLSARFSQALVVVLCRNAHAGGVNGLRGTVARTITAPLENRKLMYSRTNPAGNGFDRWTVLLDPDKSLLATWLTVAHELGHSFRLLDEYGGASGSIPANRRLKIHHSANTQALSNFVGGQLNGAGIKWNWPRVEKAAVFTGFVKSGSGFECTLAADYAKVTDSRDRFAPGNMVRLRTRDLLDNLKFSSVMTIVDAPPKSLKLKLKLATGSAAPTAPFLPWAGEGVIFKNAETDSKGRDIVHPDVAARITTTRNALNALPTDAVARPCTGGTGATGVSRATNFPAGKVPRPPRFSSWIIGAYESGATFNCNVFHPSGVCVMRESQFSDSKGDQRAYQFCHVCRYAMVDL